MVEGARNRWRHQESAIPAAVQSKEYALLWDPGTGKTFASIEVLRAWYTEEQRVLRTLIFCPPIVIENWRREIHAFSKVGDYAIPLVGTGKKRIETFKKHSKGSAIFITNYESLQIKELYEAMKEWDPEVIIWDELHKLKNPKAKRTKLAVTLSDYAERKLGLTGTAVLNSPMDLFSQFRLLDGGKTFGQHFFTFRARYFYDKNAAMPTQKHFPNWQILPGALAEIESRMARISSVAKKEECLDLPPLVLKKVYVDLSPQQRKYYEEMRRDFVTFMGDRACSADLAITKALRLQQIVSGFIPMTDDSTTENVGFKDTPRSEALKELLEEITPSHKVLVWAVFNESYKAIRGVCESLGIKYVEVHGSVTAVNKQKAVDAFNSDPEIRVLIGHPLSGGIGVNLVAASYSIFFSRNFSLEQDIQATARNYRGGSNIHEKITRIDIVAKDTIDELILKALAAKQSLSDEVLRGIAKEL